VRRAQHALELLNDPLLAECIHGIEADLIEQVRLVKLDDCEGHSRLVTAVQVLGAVTRQLAYLIQRGEMATERLNLRGKRID
jgi:hypothetical protein